MDGTLDTMMEHVRCQACKKTTIRPRKSSGLCACGFALPTTAEENHDG